MVVKVGDVQEMRDGGLSSKSGFGFHVYDRKGSRWISLIYETRNEATEAAEIVRKATANATAVMSP